ncbi:MAG: hypothetical protein WC548_00270 [Candidatus Pacearchaeota archaeon]
MQEKNKSWFRRHKILGSIIGFFLFVIGIGIISNLNSENSPTPEHNYICPELSNSKILAYDSFVQLWNVEVSVYKTNNTEVIYPYSLTSTIIYCNPATEEGQNANWVYCGDTFRPIIAQYTDKSGSIIRKRSVEIILDKNTKEYVSTKCDSYNLL